VLLPGELEMGDGNALLSKRRHHCRGLLRRDDPGAIGLNVRAYAPDADMEREWDFRFPEDVSSGVSRIAN
jgi:hypothetical protein